MEVITKQHIEFIILVIIGIQVILVSQNAIPSRQNSGGYFPNAFTEEGLAEVSVVLKCDKATHYTNNISTQLRLDLQKHNAEYPSIAMNIFVS